MLFFFLPFFKSCSTNNEVFQKQIQKKKIPEENNRSRREKMKRISSSLCVALFFVLATLIVVSTLCDSKEDTPKKKESSTPGKKTTKMTPETTASKSESNDAEVEIPSENTQKQKVKQPTKGNNDQEEQEAAHKTLEGEQKHKAKKPQEHEQKQQQRQQQQKSPSPSSPVSSAPRKTITIRGTLTNVTRMIRDPSTNQVSRFHPRGAARISVNGGDHVFFTDVSGNFAIILQVAASDESSSSNKQQSQQQQQDRVSLYQIDIDWERLVFPRVLVEVDEFGNFRAYLDGSGRIIGSSKGRMGVDPSSPNRNANNNRNEDDDHDDFFNSNEDDSSSPSSSSSSSSQLLIEAAGEVDYFIPRHQFRVWDLLKNPMVIMMLVTAGMVYVMPQLVDQDEMKTQMREMQKMAAPAGATEAVTSSGETKKVK